MTQSPTIDKLAKGLITFHVKMDAITKDASNPFFKSKYASLSNILDAIKDPLNESGLSIAQFPDGKDGLTTILMHDSGEWIQSTYEMKPIKDDPQGRGSCLTYQRRYSVCSILSLNIMEDDDANAATYPDGFNASKPKKDDRPWLNEGPTFDKVKAKLKSGEVSIYQVEDHYRLSKLIADKLKMP